jgi:hypothetical protein
MTASFLKGQFFSRNQIVTLHISKEKNSSLATRLKHARRDSISSISPTDVNLKRHYFDRPFDAQSHSHMVKWHYPRLKYRNISRCVPRQCRWQKRKTNASSGQEGKIAVRRSAPQTQKTRMEPRSIQNSSNHFYRAYRNQLGY